MFGVKIQKKKKKKKNRKKKQNLKTFVEYARSV